MSHTADTLLAAHDRARWPLSAYLAGRVSYARTGQASYVEVEDISPSRPSLAWEEMMQVAFQVPDAVSGKRYLSGSL
jgi:hypothetical protein